MTVHGFTLNIPFKSITKYLEIRIYLHSSQFTLISNDFGSLFSFFFFFVSVVHQFMKKIPLRLGVYNKNFQS